MPKASSATSARVPGAGAAAACSPAGTASIPLVATSVPVTTPSIDAPANIRLRYSVAAP